MRKRVVSFLFETYAADMEKTLAACTAIRETVWTQGLAVGSRPFVERVVREVGRSEIQYVQLSSLGAESWCVREDAQSAYAVKCGPKKGG